MFGRVLSFTPSFSPGFSPVTRSRIEIDNRFNGLLLCGIGGLRYGEVMRGCGYLPYQGKPLKRLTTLFPACVTRLKPGVNEKASLMHTLRDSRNCYGVSLSCRCRGRRGRLLLAGR